MNEQLLLKNIRGVLIRLEETIIFGLIERAQFKRNDIIYKPGAMGEKLGGLSLAEYLLRETETIHARVRRYTSPDEHPFCRELPEPILPSIVYRENPLQQNTINISEEIRKVYESEIVPRICSPGDDNQYGSSATCDVQCLQALSRRIHYGKFVAESKYLDDPGRLDALVSARDREGLHAAITHGEVERQVLERVRLKAEAYSEDVTDETNLPKVDPQVVVDVYSKWVIPMNKRVQVEYLLERGNGGH